MVKCKEITDFLEEIAPLNLAEEYDNSGLMVGNFNQDIKRVLLCLDVSVDIVEEALKERVDLIISHHPLFFKGIKKIIENEYKGEIIFKLIRNGIGVYSSHTNMDMAESGLTMYLAETLGLKEIHNLKDYKPEKLFKIVVFVPRECLKDVKDAMSMAGAGFIGNYSDCFFQTEGIGTFKPLVGTQPYKGTIGTIENVEEIRLETIVPHRILKKVINAMMMAHPYEEAAYDVYPLEININKYGYGKVGFLEKSKTLEEFISIIKNILSIDHLRIIGKKTGLIKKVAVFNGSLDESILYDMNKDIDVLITGDVKYHAAKDIAEKGLCVIDAGHYGTEKIFIGMIEKKLKEKFQDIEIICNSVEEDPFRIC